MIVMIVILITLPRCASHNLAILYNSHNFATLYDCHHFATLYFKDKHHLRSWNTFVFICLTTSNQDNIVDIIVWDPLYQTIVIYIIPY